MKKIFLFLLLTISLNGNAQNVRGFGGISGYLHSDFKGSFFAGVSCGAEFKVKNYIKPEIDLNILFGTIEEAVQRNDLGSITNSFWRSASAYNISFSPKICINNNGQNDTYLVILPKYSFSKVTAVGKYTSLNTNDVKTTTKETITDWQHSLGIGVGLDISVSNDNTDSLCLNIYYQNVDMGKALNQLSHSGASRINTNNVLGAGCNYYFSFKKAKKPRPTKIPEPLQ
ncbi:hypothetical protein CLU83_1287 [Flavobacterium sp. 1]|uniref:hypothetical protein n=1 Tax=Flavobacterium sp. 1 TaxID=2035200 RepID=UPI000C249DA0|nr:hypothetical protein [Flavobacterium sp. 1]PJJ08057.1 hypothetical protein CLU83_1287 [Flavobacterium sp. 1]